MTCGYMIKPELVKTDDGSHTLFISVPGEHYHSTFGAVQESMHIFIDAGLRQCKKAVLNIFEAGFGTGLNAYLTALEISGTGQAIRYIAVEKYPLPPEIWSKLNYPAFIPGGDPELFQKIHQAAWNQEVKITEYFSILKQSSDLTVCDFSAFPLFDLIYFDAFSPEKQPELWDIAIFRQLAGHCFPCAKIVTYCAKGVVRRSLSEAGFTPEKIPGPPGKREILRGTKNL